MGKVDLSWSLEEGYSRFVKGARVVLTLGESPWKGRLDVSPWGWLQKGKIQEAEFISRHGFRGEGPASLKWRLLPKGVVRARLLPPGSRFLGGFRVPAEHFAVAWRVEAGVESGLDGDLFDCGLMSVEAGSKLTQEWVEVFEREYPTGRALRDAWRNYVSPLEGREAARLTPAQTISWSWRGGLSLLGEIGWSLQRGWSVGWEGRPLRLVSALEGESSFQASVRFFKRGSYSLRLARRRGRLELRIVREGESGRHSRIEARVRVGPRFRIGLDPELLEPLVEPLESGFIRALERRLEISLALSANDWKRKRQLLRVLWDETDGPEFPVLYEALLRGESIPEGSGTQLSSVYRAVEGRRISLLFHLFNWGAFGYEKREEKTRTLTMSPGGDLVLERESLREARRYRWDEIQFFRLIFRQGGLKGGLLRWEFSEEGKLERGDLTRVLRAALHCGAIERFDLPGSWRLPKQGRLLWVTSFKEGAIEKMRRVERGESLRKVARAFELAEPERYRPGSPRRDWIESAQLRDLIDRDPVGSALSSRYPVPSRTQSQRHHVVTEYRKVKSFLDLFHGWAEKRQAPAAEEFPGVELEVTIFLFFHLATPAQDRASALLLSGEIDHFWGEPAVLERTR